MSPENYETYTQSLVHLAQDDARILGLIVLGSTAMTHHQPDKWSDHDFWLVVQEGTQSQFHEDLSWIPDYEPIVLAFHETEHGWKVVFADGHVLEYAIFSLSELQVVRFHHYEVLVDKVDISNRLSTMYQGFTEEYIHKDALTKTQHILSLLVIGMGRYHRGEKISSSMFIKQYALEHLTDLIQLTIKPKSSHTVDPLNSTRRIEQTHPQFFEQLVSIITATVPVSAQIILDIVVSLKNKIPDFPTSAIATVEQVIHATAT